MPFWPFTPSQPTQKELLQQDRANTIQSWPLPPPPIPDYPLPMKNNKLDKMMEKNAKLKDEAAKIVFEKFHAVGLTPPTQDEIDQMNQAIGAKAQHQINVQQALPSMNQANPFLGALPSFVTPVMPPPKVDPNAMNIKPPLAGPGWITGNIPSVSAVLGTNPANINSNTNPAQTLNGYIDLGAPPAFEELNNRIGQYGGSATESGSYGTPYNMEQIKNAVGIQENVLGQQNEYNKNFGQRSAYVEDMNNKANDFNKQITFGNQNNINPYATGAGTQYLTSAGFGFDPSTGTALPMRDPLPPPEYEPHKMPQLTQLPKPEYQYLTRTIAQHGPPSSGSGARNKPPKLAYKFTYTNGGTLMTGDYHPEDKTDNKVSLAEGRRSIIPDAGFLNNVERTQVGDNYSGNGSKGILNDPNVTFTAFNSKDNFDKGDKQEFVPGQTLENAVFNEIQGGLAAYKKGLIKDEGLKKQYEVLDKNGIGLNIEKGKNVINRFKSLMKKDNDGKWQINEQANDMVWSAIDNIASYFLSRGNNLKMMHNNINQSLRQDPGFRSEKSSKNFHIDTISKLLYGYLAQQ